MSRALARVGLAVGMLFAATAAYPALAACLPSGKSCGFNAAANDRLCCPGMVCGWGNVCRSGCRINNVLYQNGAKNPANDCQSCQPSVSTTRWSSLPSGTACGSSSSSVCDRPDSCDGAGACRSNFLPPTTKCRAPAGQCDLEEYCSGSSSECPPDAKSSAVCRPTANACDAEERCDEVADDCPADLPAADGTLCDDGSACTVNDSCRSGTCSGTEATCTATAPSPGDPIDCRPPTVVCINGLSVNILTGGSIVLWASDFLQFAQDNCTPSAQLAIGVRKNGTGSGFPTNPDSSAQVSITFHCNELGTNLVELWAKDEAGNADYCQTYVIVQDNSGNCPSFAQPTHAADRAAAGSKANHPAGFAR